MKKPIEPKNLEEMLSDAFKCLMPKVVIKSVPLKKHLKIQLDKFNKKGEAAVKKLEKMKEKENKELVKIKKEFWKQVHQDVKAKSTQKLRINEKDLTVEFLED